ncbi:AMP-binding protein [Natronoglycomyces albus]|uniref:AMP-binding protein n=2 Tax=Natronoglycomyces albus TaxID=2811108 RepID=A0A895XNE1_9ACTN|nr:AMP-binding protein [Natronoglycomyces albus]QSB06874.1 AMP-binding protein [Natronoglycomyces albus]
MESVLNHIVAQRPTGGTMTVARLGSQNTVPLSEVWDRAHALGVQLRAEGIDRGDRVGIVASNGLDWVLLDLACLFTGVETAGFEPGKFTADAQLAQRYGLRAVYTDDASALVAARPGGPVRSLAEVVRRAHAMSAEASDSVSGRELIEYGPTDTTSVKFTSGSTGVPKGLAATVGSIDSSLHAVQGIMRHQVGDNLFVFLPLSLLQQRYWVYSALRWGHDVTVTTYESAFAVLGSHAPTVVMGVPGFFGAAMRHIEGQLPEDASFKQRRSAAVELFGPNIRYLWTGSAPADMRVLGFFTDVGLPIYEGYGLNETCIVSKNYPGANRTGSVGKVLPGKEVFIDEGVVCVRSDHPVNHSYAFAADGESEKMFRPGGVVRTGDLGHIDADGYLYIHGRADDVVVLDNGKKIVVRPIEARLRASEAIAECIVYCRDQTELVAIASSDGVADPNAVAQALKKANAEAEPDEQIRRVILAQEPFSIAAGTLTSQFKPVRRAIVDKYEKSIFDPKAGIHAT